MNVGLHDADGGSFPNLVLMKLSAAYKAAGHNVEFWDPSKVYDKVVSSKVFTFTPEVDLPAGAVKGGVGYGCTTILPDAIEHICPDYTLYGITYSLGFTTRGCDRKCSHCFVPWKEGSLRGHADVAEFLRHKDVVLMDNNPLGCNHGIAQIEKLATLGVRVDFNQGLDARLIDDGIARRLAALKWLAPLRLACDHSSQMSAVQKAVEHLRWHNCTPATYSCYVLVKDVDDALERVRFLKGIKVDPFCQPYIDKTGTPPTLEQRQLARWVNTKMLFKKMTFNDYKVWRGGRV